MKTFEDDVRDMLRRRAEDLQPAAPPWPQLAAEQLHHRAVLGARPRRLVAVAALVAMVIGVVGLQAIRRDGSPPPPAVDTSVVVPPPFDPESTAAIWPVGRDGTAASWFRTAFEEFERLQPPPSDDPTLVAGRYLRDRFGPMRVVLDDTGRHGGDTAEYRWRVPIDTQDATGHVYLRRVVLPNSFQQVQHAWVVVGATSDHLRVNGLHVDGGRLQFELARHKAPFASTADVHLPTGVTPVDLDRPRFFDVALDQPVTIRAQLMGGAALTLTEFRVDPSAPLLPGDPLTDIVELLEVVPNRDMADAARRFLIEHFDAGPDLVVEAVGGDSFDVRYRSSAIGSGTVRMGRTGHASIVVAVVGDGLAVETMAVVGTELRRVTLASAVPGRVSATIRSKDVVIGQGRVRLPGPGMLVGLPVYMTAPPDPDHPPVLQLRVDGPRGPTVAMYALPI